MVVGVKLYIASIPGVEKPQADVPYAPIPDDIVVLIVVPHVAIFVIELQGDGGAAVQLLEIVNVPVVVLPADQCAT